MVAYEIRSVDGDATLADAHAVRRAVFIDEQGVSEAVEMDDRDAEATHFVGYEADTDDPVGTARLRFVDDDTAKIERVAVSSAHRGAGLGTKLMRRAEVEARKQGCTRVCLHAQTSVESFYHDLGYETVSEPFEQADIPHIEMGKTL